MAKIIRPAKNKKASSPKRAKLKTITFDQWAASGGTVGIFAADVRAGRIKIVDEEV